MKTKKRMRMKRRKMMKKKRVQGQSGTGGGVEIHQTWG
jgi:hypothetical protein